MSIKSMSDDRLLTERQLEEKIGWTRGTGAVKRSRGDMPLPHVKIGKRVFYRLSDFDAYVVDNTVAPKTRLADAG